MRQIFKSFNKIEQKSHHGFLHAFKETPRTKAKILNKLSKENFSVLCIFIDKKKIYARLKDEKHILYNYAANILLDRITNQKIIPIKEPIFFIASRRETKKILNNNFRAFLNDQIKRNHGLSIKIEIKTPSQEKCLQIVDLISWTIFRKYEHYDDSYYNLIKQKIVEENPLFP